MLYEAAMHSVLLYGSDSWVVTGAMLKVLEGLHHRLARRITGMMAMNRDWEWTPADEALETAGLWPIKEYIQRRQNKIAAQVSCRTIYEL